MGPTFTIPWHDLAIIAFYLLLIVYVTYSVVLYYHWSNYSIDNKASMVTYGLYFGISLPLIGIMAVCTLFF